MGADGGDRARILACFDETSAAVFASLCRLLSGDVARAVDALVQTYCTLDTTSAEPLDAAARVFLATAPPTAVRGVADAAALSPIERAVAELSLVRHLSPAEISSMLDRPMEQIRSALDAAVEALSIGGGRADAPLPRGEVWFDDAMRAEARQRLSSQFGDPEPSSASRRRSRRRTNALIGVASAVVGAALVLWVLAGTRDGSGTAGVPEPPGTRSLPTSAAVGTTTTTPSGVVASGTISSIAGSATTDVAAALSTATPTTEAPATETAPTTSIRPVGFLLDPVPDGFAAFSAMDVETDGGPQSSWQAVWSSVGAARTSGRWFAVAVTDDHPTLQPSSDAFGHGPVLRFTSAERSMQLFADSDGVQHTRAPLDEGALIEFASFGVSADEISTLVDAAAIGDDKSITFGPAAAAVLDGLSVRATMPIGQDVLAPTGFFREDFATLYSTADGNSILAVSSGKQQPNDLLTASLLLAPSADAAAPVAPDRTVEVAGHLALVGQWDLGFGSAVQMVMWHAGGRTILVRGTVGLDVALQAARTARLASIDEWRTMLDARPPLITNSPPGQGALNEAQIGSTITRDGSTWIVKLNDAHLAAGASDRLSDGAISIAEVRPGSGNSSADPSGEQWFPLLLDPSQPLSHFESLDATVLVVALSQPTDAAFMRVTVDDSKRVDVPIIAVPDTKLAGAAYAFSEVAPFTIDVLDANGAVLQILTP